jgi:enoyl-CoA hydratase/carnithine racemase
VRAIVLAANGPAFCAGADLNWMKKMAGYTQAENEADALRLADMLRTIYCQPEAGGGQGAGRLLRRRHGPGGGLRHRGGRRRRELLPVRSEAGPDPGHDFSLRHQGDGRAGLAPLLPHRRALRRAEAKRLGLAHEVVPPKNSTPPSPASSRRWSTTARTPCAKRRSWCATSPGCRSTMCCWPIPPGASPISVHRRGTRRRRVLPRKAQTLLAGISILN